MPEVARPRRIEYEVGQDQHGRMVILTRTDKGWNIMREPGDQRDDQPSIEGIPHSTMLILAATVLKEEEPVAGPPPPPRRADMDQHGHG